MPAPDPARGPLTVTLYAKPGCHLCDELYDLLRDLQEVLPFTLVERNIADDPRDFARYRDVIPVVEIPGAETLVPPHDAGALRDALLASIQARDGS